jgi:hypothetical protein
MDREVREAPSGRLPSRANEGELVTSFSYQKDFLQRKQIDQATKST